MLEGREEFARQLQELGYELLPVPPDPTQPGNRVVTEYVVPGGRFAGKRILLGFEVDPTFPRTPPGGPHLSPRVLPINSAAADHPHRVHESPTFGPEWEYLSRPYRGKWRGREAVSEYLAHVDHIFRTT
jgi:hypothetical protein